MDWRLETGNFAKTGRLEIIGNLVDLDDTDEVAALLVKIVPQFGTHVILDCSQIVINGHGIAGLVRAYAELKKQTPPVELVLVDLPSRFQSKFTSKKLDQIGLKISYLPGEEKIA